MMRKVLISIALMLCGFLAAAQSRVDTIRQHLLTPGDGTVLVAAHRGDWRNAPVLDLLPFAVYSETSTL